MSRIAPALMCLCILAYPVRAQDAPAGQDSYPPADEADWDAALDMEADKGLTIVGTRQTSQQMKVITKEDIEKANAPDLAALLEETAGLSTARYGPYGSQGDINLRGFDAERVAFLIDGAPANSPASSEFDYSQIDLNSIERIEIIYGGSDSRYSVSGAIGGVINIITVKKRPPGLRISGGLSNMSAMPGEYYKPQAGDQPPQFQDLFDAQNISLAADMGLKNGSWNINWFANRAANHFLYWDSRFQKTRRKENNEIWDTGISAAYIREFTDLSKLIVNGHVYCGDKNIPKSGYSEQYDKLSDIAARENVMLEMPRAFHDTLAMEASLSHLMQRQDMSGGSAVTAAHSITGINRWTWYPADRLTLRAAADYRYSFVETLAFHDRHEGGVSLGLEWSPRRDLTLVPSIKAAFQNNGEPAAVPKLGLLWKPAQSLEIRNNYFRSYKIPDMIDLYWQGSGEWGNPGLKSEDGWGGDFGAAWNHTTRRNRRISLDGNVYAQWYDNSIHWYNGRPRNVGGAFFYGADAGAALSLPLERGPFRSLKVSLSYQYMMSYLLAYGFTLASDKRIPYMPVHRPGLRTELAWKTGSAALSGFYEAERIAEDYITVLDPYFFLSLNINQRIGGRFTVYAVMRNLLNFQYQSFKDYPMPGFTLTLGARIQLEFSGGSGGPGPSGGGVGVEPPQPRRNDE